MDALTKVAKLIELREKGEPVHDAILKVFKPKEQPPGQQPQDPLAAMMAGAGAPAPEGGAPAPTGGGEQVPQGMDLMSLLSGLNSKGEATMSSRTQRQGPI